MLEHALLMSWLSLLHMSQMMQMYITNVIWCVRWRQECMGVHGYEWVRLSVRGWVHVGVCGKNFQNTFWRQQIIICILCEFFIAFFKWNHKFWTMFYSTILANVSSFYDFLLLEIRQKVYLILIKYLNPSAFLF